MSLFANLQGWSSPHSTRSSFPGGSFHFPQSRTNVKANASTGRGYFALLSTDDSSNRVAQEEPLAPNTSDTNRVRFNDIGHAADKLSPSFHTPSAPPPALPPSGPTSSSPDASHAPRDRDLESIIQESEISWVRSGGILRDSASGKRDIQRTELIRADLRLQAEEARLIRRWETYELRWAVLSANTRRDIVVTFADIPWPVDKDPRTVGVDDVKVDAVREFLFAPLTVRSRTDGATKRSRVRASLLRWHPDKLGTIMACVISDEDEKERIKQGIATVMVCLQQLQGEAR